MVNSQTYYIILHLISDILDNRLKNLTHLSNTGRLDYYNCWLFSLVLKRDWDRNVSLLNSLFFKQCILSYS